MSSLPAMVQGIFNEPGCARNANKSDAERKKGCTKQLQPGSAAGGCAFDGAKIALQPFTDVAHLVHGPIACEGNSWDNRGAASSGSSLWRSGFTTDMTETDVVFGGEKRLYKAIKEIVDKCDPPAIFVYQTCIPAMIGDDIDAVCKSASQKFGKPIIPVNAPGFVGSKNLGNKLAGEALLEHVIGTQEPEYTTPYDINLIGEYNLSGELWQVKPLLDELGIRILSCISGDGRYREVASSHRARAAMLVCSKAMINVARKMEQRYGIPFFEGSFYGIQDSSDSLRQIARLLVERGAAEELIARTEAVIVREEARAWAAIEPYKPRFKGKKVLLITGGVKSWSVVAALQEAGLELVGTSVKKSTSEDKERIKELLRHDAHMIEDMPPREMYKMLKDAKADIMLSGGKSQFVALKAAMPWLDINQERCHAYLGYVGMVKLVSEIDKSLSNPMWEQLRRPAPWDALARALQTHSQSPDSVSDPALKQTSHRAKKICFCNTVELGTIEDAIRSRGLTSVEAVRQHTNAVGGCCRRRIENLLASSPSAMQAAE
ncbi:MULTISPECIES: nitrogenase iron-molybdenum cofactor biosynthesis protein NifE [unclassified Bradyrhizobium]|uniref:nitrogenase iron-molybdenum cofactor biosynthesis protein NifE n=1 Tax=unclassified Bradyrhizobium TaxID=2631580 RepID=UPI00247935D0|nr:MULTISPECIES: nitrogenase iron-molybdenum cofactor biosynthesis protein NifE [unclassified Bradyrhizobium]WGR93603.1 nitrogenase iron-molybdenum cofactor biosynthesis protein NifE [Bradyrhizobium sp. ISRA435]WGS02830.1 nitrogenase iron-molybdenum cofactor biosynthesis protein NifE [Bradyrhizobium sp. ISRA436]WGS09716.1 nitrogenase iron-molybdenum cofactor biosynthesis protein NifE [Bradyrhizobium sp. ISRA437]WGS16599.1 nitrogenase iron-molybdenum cofactor biosynthesis protein NifE [Bradyrhiz